MSCNYEFLLHLASKGKRVVSDSRKVESGDIFVALSGTKVDGSIFMEEALQKGASFVLSKNKEVTSRLKDKAVYHPNPNLALGELANRYYFPQGRKIKLIGITGTNGKTTTAYLTHYALSQMGYKAGLIGTVEIKSLEKSYQAALTTPDCLTLYSYLAQMEKEGIEYVCLEVSSHALDQDRVAGLDFEVGIFTNLTQDHLDYHRDMEHYFQAKKKLFQDYAKNAVINGDCSWGKRLIQELKKDVFTYGFKEQNQFRVLEYEADLQGIKANLLLQQEQRQVFLPLLGEYNLYNLLASLSALLSLNLKVDFDIFKDFKGVPGRLEKIKNKRNLNVIVDYAHTPDALDNVCSTLRKLPFKRLIVLFGCGGNRDKGKRALMAKAVSKWADMAIVTSDNPREEEPLEIIKDILPGFPKEFAYLVEVDRKQAILKALAQLESQDLLLIAGKGHEDYQEIKGVRYPFSDKQIVQGFLNES